MNWPFKIKAIVTGILKHHNTKTKVSAMILNSTWNILHPKKSYKNEIQWFLDLWDARSYGHWEAIAFSPSCIVFGFFELLKRRLV